MPPGVGTLLRPLVLNWLRGSVTREFEYFLLERATAEAYSPLDLDRRHNVGVALARVRTPEDAVAFIEKYGLLTYPGERPRGQPLPQFYRESFSMFEHAADTLRGIIHIVFEVRAAVRGDRDALDRLRLDFAEPYDDPDIEEQFEAAVSAVGAGPPHGFDHLGRDERVIVSRACFWAGIHLADGMKGLRAYVFEPAFVFPKSNQTPGELRFYLASPTLLGYCFLSVANALSFEPLKICGECGRVFIVEDKRQKFCETACANRARFRRFKANKAGGRPGRKSHDGKKTRAR